MYRLSEASYLLEMLCELPGAILCLGGWNIAAW
jgi:hypothetical protein